MADVSLANGRDRQEMWSRNGLKFVPKELDLSVPCVLGKEILLHTIRENWVCLVRATAHKVTNFLTQICA